MPIDTLYLHTWIHVGYLVFYTTDAKQKDRDWVVEGVLGDRLSATIKDLSLETTYYFKVQARNHIGYGPTSPTIVFRTPRSECSHSRLCCLLRYALIHGQIFI